LRHVPAQKGSVLFLQHDSIFESYGGVQYYIDDFLTFLSNLYGPNQLKVLLAQRTDNFKVQSRPYSIETVRLSQGLLKKIENRLSLKYFFKALDTIRTQKPSFIIASHLSLAPMAAILSRITKTPFLVIAYGFEVWGDFQPQDKWALKKADGIISISYWTKAILEKQGFEGIKISIVHPTLSSEMVNRPTSTKTADAATLRLLTISRLDSTEQYKGHDHVLEALKIIKDKNIPISLNYTIQGTGDDLPRLQNLVENYDLKDSVVFLPSVKSRESLKDTYQSHDVFIMPSRFGYWNRSWKGEGFGIVYVEAALFGVPSIAYRCGGVTDIIEDQKTGILVEPDDVQALAKAIIGLAQDKQRIVKLGENAREMALQKFTPERIELEMQKAFEAYPFCHLEPTLS
jgi:glycosyltransferase involved in cell wall biosynthesis